jgi:hypothetical protein
MQAAVMFVLAEEDPVEPLHISNLIAMRRGLVAQPPDIELDLQSKELLTKPYARIHHMECPNLPACC